MKGIVKWFDEAPLWLKVIFALPGLDIIWAIYRIIKGAAYGKIGLILIGILWIVLGWAILWVIDIVSILVAKRPWLS